MKKSALKIAAAFLATAIASAPAVAAGDEAGGKDLFKKKCKTCHTTKANGKSGLGPNLHGVIGRQAGTLENYKKYSDGLKGSGVVWDEAALNKLMENPKAFVAGSKMKSGKIEDAGQRGDIIAYLNSLK